MLELTHTLPMKRKERMAENIVADIRSKRSTIDDGGSKVDSAEHASISYFVESAEKLEKNRVTPAIPSEDMLNGVFSPK